MKKDFAEPLYVFSSFAALLIFTAMFINYMINKQIRIYLLVAGVFALLIGFVAKKITDKSNEN